MPTLTEINHEDFIKKADSIQDLDFCKTELKKWINKSYSRADIENSLHIKYLYIAVILLLLEIIKLIFNKKNRMLSSH